MLEIQDLVTYHGNIQVLRQVNLKVDAGKIVALIGANGAGKSTLMGTIAGIYRSRGGAIRLKGEEITGLPAEKVVRRGISLVPERRQVFDQMTVVDNFYLGAFHRYRRDKGLLADEIREILEIFPLLKGKEKELAGNLSGGLQQMVAIGRGLMAKPQVLMLDEPSVGLAPMVVKEIMNTLAELRKQGTTIFLVEQNARAALKIADDCYVMDRGQILLHGRADELLEDPRVQMAYLGKGYHHTTAEEEDQ